MEGMPRLGDSGYFIPHDLSDCFKDGHVTQVGSVGLKTIDFAVTIRKKILFY